MNFWGHLSTVVKHRRMVMYHAFKVGIPIRGLLHDLSKYSPSEFFAGVKYYTDGSRSPNEAEREINGCSAAWMHHKGRNKHHFEYWIDFSSKEKKQVPVKMPLVYVKEMFCDRVAASKIYQKEKYTDSHPIEYFEGGKANRIIHKETSDLLEKLLYMLSQKGEKETFEYIKNLKKY